MEAAELLSRVAVDLRGEFAHDRCRARCPLCSSCIIIHGARAAIVRFRPLPSSVGFLITSGGVRTLQRGRSGRKQGEHRRIESPCLGGAGLGFRCGGAGGIRVPGCGFAFISWYGATARLGICSFCFGAAGGIMDVSARFGAGRRSTSQSRCGGWPSVVSVYM